MRRLIVVLAMAAVVLGTALSAHGEFIYSVADLGDLPGGENWSAAGAINAAGQVAGMSQTAGGHHAFLYSDGVMIDLGVLADDHTISFVGDINNAGQVAGSSLIDDLFASQRPYIYSNGTMTDLGSHGGDYGFALGINNAGDVVGLSSDAHGVTHAFRWSNGAMIDLESLDGSYSCAYAINDVGQIVGISTLNGAVRGFIWENGNMTDLGDLPGMEHTRAYAINNSGQVVGESVLASTTVGNAFLWDDGAMTDLGVLPETNSSYALGINDNGLVVGASFNRTTTNPKSDSDQRAFLWDTVNGIRDLNNMLDSSGNGWTLHRATDINQAGQIVGTGTNLSGLRHAFLLTVIPEPSTLVLLAMGAVGLLLYALRRRKQII